MGSVRIGAKFFEKELLVYSQWSTAFWRENLQNSFDAGSTRIDITVRESVNGVTSVIISDNGSGMDRETLENVYFTLGETSKTGNSVGGFGKARILTCFAQQRYCLRTKNLLVEGSGADYTILDKEAYHQGVELEIDVYDKGENLVQRLNSYLSKCHLENCVVTVNGIRHTDWTYRNKFERDLSFGKVYTNKSKSPGILVRVNGVQMFSPYTSAPFLVIIEIDQTKSRSVLQSNRDGLTYIYQSELESFVSELNINKKSAFRARHSKSVRYNGTGTFGARRKTKTNTSYMGEPTFGMSPNSLVAALLRKTPSSGLLAHQNGFTEDHQTVDQKIKMFDINIQDNTSNMKVRKVIDSYDPRNWQLTGQGTKIGMSKFKLLVLWKAACEYVVGLLQNELNQGPEYINWGVGWCFSDEAAAQHKSDGTTHWLLLNPCEKNGCMRIPQNRKGFAKLIAEACHEVCHIIHSYHDEEFSTLLTDMLEKAFDHKTELLNSMKREKETLVKQLG